MRKLTVSFFLSFLFVFLSCSSVKITSIKNDTKTIKEVSGILVFCDITDIETRKALEEEIANEFIKQGKSAKDSISLFPPVRNYDASEIYNESIKNGLNTKLFISLMDSSKETGYVMTTYGMILPVSSTTCSFDVLLQIFNDEEVILHSTLVSSGRPLYTKSEIAKKIVNEVLTEETKENLQLFKEKLSTVNSELLLENTKSNKYTITGKSKICDITLYSKYFTLDFPQNFKSISDDKNLVEEIKKDEKFIYRITVNDAENLEYIADLINQYYEKMKK